MINKDFKRRRIVVYTAQYALKADGYQRFEKVMEV